MAACCEAKTVSSQDILFLRLRTNCPSVGTMILSFRSIIDLWPSPDALALEIGARVEAVRKWRQRDNIPAPWWSAIVLSQTAQSAEVTFAAMANLAARRAEARAS